MEGQTNKHTGISSTVQIWTAKHIVGRGEGKGREGRGGEGRGGEGRAGQGRGFHLYLQTYKPNHIPENFLLSKLSRKTTE